MKNAAICDTYNFNASLDSSVVYFIPILMLVSFPFHSDDDDDAIIRPLPRAKQTLSEPNILPHMVQLLLTFDPRLVEKVVTLLNMIIEVGSHN